MKERGLSIGLSSPFSALVVQELLFGHVSCESAASHRHKDVQVEAVVGLPEEEDEDEAEEAGAGQTPVQPGQLWKRGDKRAQNYPRWSETQRRRRVSCLCPTACP